MCEEMVWTVVKRALCRVVLAGQHRTHIREHRRRLERCLRIRSVPASRSLTMWSGNLESDLRASLWKRPTEPLRSCSPGWKGLCGRTIAPAFPVPLGKQWASPPGGRWGFSDNLVQVKGPVLLGGLKRQWVFPSHLSSRVLQENRSIKLLTFCVLEREKWEMMRSRHWCSGIACCSNEDG